MQKREKLIINFRTLKLEIDKLPFFTCEIEYRKYQAIIKNPFY